MHYQASNVMKPGTVVTALLAECPWFAKVADIEESPYNVLSDFAIYLRDGINNDAIQSEELKQAFRFLNAMGASDDLEVQNQLVVGVLEILTDSDKSTAVTRQELEGPALEQFGRILSGWNNA